MKNKIIALIIGLSSFAWTNNSFAYLNTDVKSNKQGKNPVNQAKGASCAPATAKLFMEFNDVRALIEQGGSMFQDRAAGNASYEIPRGSGLHVIYAGALWMGGTDVNGQLKLAGLTFRNVGNDFWPGPLTVDPSSSNYNPNQPVGDGVIRAHGEANIDVDVCVAYDKFYTIRKSEVIQYTIWWNCDQDMSGEGCDEVSQPSADVMNRINNWPAHGDFFTQDYYLAPFYDFDNNGVYDPSAGDTPWYDDILGRDDIQCGVDRRISLFGDETNWWVFNDKGNIHTESQGEPIGMEIRAQAFSFATSDEVNRMTFFNYELINRGTQTLFNTYFSQYLDADIGNFADDYVGCDVSRGLSYIYNGNLIDNGTGGPSYGVNPPAVGVDFFEGPYQDSDGKDNVGPYYDPVGDSLIVPTVSEALADNGIVYSGIGLGYGDSIVDNERFGMRGFVYYTGSGTAYPYRDPVNASEYYNFMRGTWANGELTYYGGLGSIGSPGVTNIETDYMYPRDSDPLNWGTGGVEPGFDWDENTNSNAPADRRFVQSAGPFTLTPGAVNNITVGIVYGRGTDGTLFGSVDALLTADTKAQALFDACFAIISPPDAPKLVIQELENQLVLILENPLSSSNFLEAYHQEDKVNITDPTVDRFYTFEGYQIYQMIDNEAGVADINDATKSRLVAQCDIKNEIDRLINYEFDDPLGLDIPVEKVDGENNGIRHSFLLTEDQFAQGNRTLVNHKTYYYIAVAYAHNEFKKFDPNDPAALDGQKTPYISSRLSFDGTAIQSVPAIPHNPILEAGGTIQNVSYGSSPIITRLDGYGNGNRDLELTQASVNAIVNTGFYDTPSYEYGKGPIDIKVVDPLNVVGGYFECKFIDYSPSNNNGTDTASWVIYQYSSKGGNLMDSVHSDFSIDFDNEQIIAKWGVSVKIHQNLYYLPEGLAGSGKNLTTDMISSSLEFSDSSKIWLTGVNDNDSYFPTNWIRSGIFIPNDDSADPLNICGGTSYFDPCNYSDYGGTWSSVNSAQPSPWDEGKNYSRILGGIVAPHKMVGFESDFMPMAYLNLSESAILNLTKSDASISFLPSVDIVFTSDKSKWTRCPVIELGRDVALNIGGAQPGEMRKSPSVDVNGNVDPTSTGMGWFPGYAIDIESGARLYMAFGENSFLGGENGSDMIWNPTDRIIDGVGTPLMGGMHAVYVWGYHTKEINNFFAGFDYPAYIPNISSNLATHVLYNDMLLLEANNSNANKRVYKNLAWISYPLLEPGHGLLETDVRMRLRINKEYKNFVATGQNGGAPMYSWSMDDIATEIGSDTQLASALDLINVVPNPYYAYSQYERNRLDTRVKITNLPEVCTVKIYSANGKLIRTFKKDSPITSIDWDLNNHKGIPIAGGVYIIHIDVPDIGEKIVKFFGGIRQVDLQGI